MVLIGDGSAYVKLTKTRTASATGIDFVQPCRKAVARSEKSVGTDQPPRIRYLDWRPSRRETGAARVRREIASREASLWGLWQSAPRACRRALAISSGCWLALANSYFAVHSTRSASASVRSFRIAGTDNSKIITGRTHAVIAKPRCWNTFGGGACPSSVGTKTAASNRRTMIDGNKQATKNKFAGKMSPKSKPCDAIIAPHGVPTRDP